MKVAIIIPDGCADYPVESLGGKTPLEAAKTPAMDAIAKSGVVGRSDNVPLQFPAGSEVANMSLLGYDPHTYFTGRAPIEAAAMGIVLGPYDWAIRCNLVTISDQVMSDFTADHITTAESAELLATLNATLGDASLEFVPGVSYRNILVYRGSATVPSPFSSDTRTSAPHDLTDESVIDDFPRGPGCDLLCELMEKSHSIFADHPVNKKRISQGLKPATNIWLWGLGKTPQLESFESRFGMRGAMVTAVDLLRGLAALVGWDRIEVVGATGYLDTDYRAKGIAAVEALKDHDIVCVHIEAPDEASHEGRADEKVKALEQIDEHIVAPVHEAIRKYGEYRILVMPDHPTPVQTKKHAHGWVPFAACGSQIKPGSQQAYNETEAGKSGIEFPAGWELIPKLVTGKPLQ